jgi:tetratricopeptide (TPR) repeat protein
MMVVPRQEEVRLVYSRTAADGAGLALSAGALVLAGATAIRLRRRSPSTGRADDAAVVPHGDFGLSRPRRWGAVIPVGLLLALAVPRVFGAIRGARTEEGTSRAGVTAQELYERASRAHAAGRFEDAAEYARLALGPSQGSSFRAELLCLRGESLLRAGHPEAALEAFDTLLGEGPRGPYAPQALFGEGEAHAALGDASEARRARDRLLREFPDTPWAERARLSSGAAE